MSGSALPKPAGATGHRNKCGKLVFHLSGALVEFERDLIGERTQAGLVAARARGGPGGRRVTHHRRADPTTHRDEPPHSTTGLDLLGDPAGSGLPSTPTVQATAGTPPACRSRTCSRRRLGSQSPTRPYPSKNASSRARAGGEGRFRVGHCRPP